ncbi:MULTISPECIES: hypothetical protein [unclassified Pannonibacter]|uniref:hypothetical protein n=1 Tax=unclassified Pannonibacter TaxID=2627228 RepID=UPI00352BBB8A
MGRRLFKEVYAYILKTGGGSFYLTNPNIALYKGLGGREIDAPDVELGQACYRQIAFTWCLCRT